MSFTSRFSFMLIYLFVCHTLKADPDTPFEDIRQKAEATVVNIISHQVLFNWQEPYKTAEALEGSGSGFFINDQGDILTNYHVIAQATKVWIQFLPFGEEKISATIKGVCPERDLALLQLSDAGKRQIVGKLRHISYLRLGDSDQVKRGDRVVGFGYPLGQIHLKASTGVISGPEYAWSRSWFQTTAPLNGGNSGGPLLNMAGEVIGITTAGIEKAANIGYALPINEYKLIASELEKNRLVRKPFMGLKFTPSSTDYAHMVGNPPEGGIYVSAVLPGSLAHQLGMQPGDALYELDGYALDAYGQASVEWRSDKLGVEEIIHRLPKNKEIPIVFYRQGKRHEKKLVMADLPPRPIRKMYPDFEQIDYEIIAGLVIMQLTDNHLEEIIKSLHKFMQDSPEEIPEMSNQFKYILRYGLPENKHQPVLMVSSLIPGSLAMKQHSIEIADVLEQVNGKKVSTIDDLRTALYASLKTGYVTFKSKLGQLLVLPLKQVLADEQQLSEQLKYQISPFVKEMMATENKDVV